jgi:hypothetical protein
MLICLGGGGILGLHDLRIVPLKPGWREYICILNVVRHTRNKYLLTLHKNILVCIVCKGFDKLENIFTIYPRAILQKKSKNV